MRPRRIQTSARFLWRSLSLRRSSFLLALLAVTVAASLTATLLGMRADLRLKMSRELKGYGPNLLVTPAQESSALLEEGKLRSLTEILRSKGVSGEVGMSPLLLATGRIRSAGSEAAWEGATLVGARFSTLKTLNPSWKIEGAWPGEEDDACAAGASLAARVGLSAGQSIEVATAAKTRPCRVAGILATGESEDEEIFLPLRRLQEDLDLRGRISLLAVSVGGGAAQAARAARAVEIAVPGTRGRVLWEVAQAQGTLLDKLDRLSLSLSVVVFLLCGLCVMTTLLSMVMEREPEIGLMRSLGAGDGEILLMFLGEVSLLAILGALAGLLVGAGASRWVGRHLFEISITPRLEIVWPVVALALALCWSSVLIPLRRALTIRPAEALRGN
jgi:putative ABC transport system permease protein